MSTMKENLSDAGGHLKQAAIHASDSMKSAASAVGEEFRLGGVHVKSELSDGAQAGKAAAGQAGAAAKEQMDALMGKGRDMVDSAADLIRERPLTAFGIALAAGWVISRLARSGSK